MSKKESLKVIKKHACRVAEDLCYPSVILDRIMKAESEREITNLLKQARLDKQ